MKNQSSYYTKGIRRKFSAFLFDKNMINTDRQAKLINEHSKGATYPLKKFFNLHYGALNYLPENYSEKLSFKNNIAVAEKNGFKNPLTPAVYALHSHNYGKIELFNKHIDFILGKAQKKGSYYFWEYTEDMVRFEIPSPWVSGISQGLIASALIRKYVDSKDEKYLEMAKGVIGFCLDKENGLRAEVENGFWIEEYPSSKGAGVLNGFIFFLIALGELASFGIYENEFDEGVQVLLSKISSYHKGIYLKYASNIPDLCNPWYDQIHYHQLLAMYALTKETVFIKLKDYWVDTSTTIFKT